jgi:cell division protein FtsQ
MPKIERNDTLPSRSRARIPATFVDEATGEEVRVSSVIFGIVMLVAIVVATAAWMGGSLSQIESRFAGFVDDTARLAGVSVNDVSVIGLEADPVLATDIRDAAMIEPGENMFRADPHVIRRRVEATQKVLNVRVHRLWPDQIVIIAEAAEPVAVWHDGRSWAVVDSLGRVIPGARASDHTRLLRLAGIGGAAAAPKIAGLLKTRPDLAGRIAIATRVADRRWDLRMITGITVRLPEDKGLETAIARLASLQSRTALTERGLSRIDLSHDGRVYLTPNVPTAPPPTAQPAPGEGLET